MESYNWQVANVATLTLRNTGSTPVQISDVFLNGVVSTITAGGASYNNPPGIIHPESACTLAIATGSAGSVQGVVYPVKVVSVNGAIFEFSLVCGESN